MDNTIKEQECPQVTKQIMVIEKIITSIEDNVNSLNLRLEKVLRFEEVIVKKEDSTPIQNLVPMAENLKTSTNRLENINYSLQSVLDKLEL